MGLRVVCQFASLFILSNDVSTLTLSIIVREKEDLRRALSAGVCILPSHVNHCILFVDWLLDHCVDLCVCVFIDRMLSFVLGRHPTFFTITAYFNVDWAGKPDDWLSTLGYAIFPCHHLISWSTKKQPTVAGSTTESE